MSTKDKNRKKQKQLQAAVLSKDLGPMGILDELKDDSYHYRFERDEPLKLKQREREGYVPVQVSEAKEIAEQFKLGNNQDVESDGDIVTIPGGTDKNGNRYRLILLKCPMEVYLQREKLRDERRKKRLQAEDRDPDYNAGGSWQQISYD